MLRINHILLLLILLASHMDSQLVALWLCYFLPAPPQIHEPTISSTLSLPICEPIFISPTSYRNSPMGPPPFIIFPEIYALPGALISHWGTRFCICTFFPNYFILSCTNTFYYHPFLLSSPLATYFPFWPHATQVTLGWSLTSHLPSPASSISSEYYLYHLPIPYKFVHLVPPLAQLIPDLVIPLTLDLVTQLRPHLLSCTLQPREVWSLPTC